MRYDILALSNYPWNHALDLELFETMRDIHPETLRVMGGSNISHESELQSEFLRTNEIIDVYVYLEGEIGFSNIVERILQEGEINLQRSHVLTPRANLSEGRLFRGLRRLMSSLRHT